MTRIVSIQESPEYTDRAIDYISSRWNPDNRILYQDCISHCAGAGNLPQWYLLLNGDEIIGCAGLITNDFISRMDLCPWLCALYIEEAYRGNAYSRSLIDRAKEDARQAGFRKLFLSTDHTGLYEKFGFEYIGYGYHPWGERSRIYEVSL